MNTFIRAPTEADSDAILVINELCFSVPFNEKWYEEQRAKPEYGTLVAADRDSSQIFGFVNFLMRPEGGYVNYLAVAPECQGTGLGRKLLQAIAQKVLTAGKAHIRLHTDPSDSKALGFYESLGFKEQARMKNWYGTGNVGYLMRLDLHSADNKLG
jgi:ribosomal protein S18 acetylase RimI-like enzyme